VHRTLDPPVAVGRCQRKVGRESEVHTSEAMSEINTNDDEHRKGLQHKAGPNEISDSLVMMSRAALIRCLHHTFDL